MAVTISFAASNAFALALFIPCNAQAQEDYYIDQDLSKSNKWFLVTTEPEGPAGTYIVSVQNKTTYWLEIRCTSSKSEPEAENLYAKINVIPPNDKCVAKYKLQLQPGNIVTITGSITEKSVKLSSIDNSMQMISGFILGNPNVVRDKALWSLTQFSQLNEATVLAIYEIVDKHPELILPVTSCFYNEYKQYLPAGMYYAVQSRVQANKTRSCATLLVDAFKKDGYPIDFLEETTWGNENNWGADVADIKDFLKDELLDELNLGLVETIRSSYSQLFNQIIDRTEGEIRLIVYRKRSEPSNYNPTIQVTPTFGSVNDNFFLSGEGFNTEGSLVTTFVTWQDGIDSILGIPDQKGNIKTTINGNKYGPGTYTIYVVDLSGTDKLSNSSNKVTLTITDPNGLPDLVVTEIKPLAVSVEPGNSINLDFSICNQGKSKSGSFYTWISLRKALNVENKVNIAAVADSMKLTTEISSSTLSQQSITSDILIGKFPFSSLAADTTTPVSANVNIPSYIDPGEYYVYVFADAPAPGAITESHENNNSKLTQQAIISIVLPTKKDLTYKSHFIVESYPDNSQVMAGQSFIKTWTLQNSGTASWTANCRLQYISGDLSQSKSDIAVNGTVGPNQQYTFSVPMRAPSTLGTFTENWKFTDPNGTTIKVDNSDIIWSKISVSQKSDNQSIALTLNVHYGSISGSPISGATVSGYDGASVPFSQTTVSSGNITIHGAPGTWQLNASKIGYQPYAWSQIITISKKDDVFLTMLASAPQINGVSPSQPTANPSRQWLTINGSGFVSGSQVTLRIGGSEYPISIDRTTFVGSSQIQVYAGLTDAGSWTAQVTNPVGSQSNIYTFQVQAAQINYSLSVTTQGQGSVSLNPSGGSYASGSPVTLTASAASGWQFSGWSGGLSGSQNPATISMTSAKSITANFSQVASPQITGVNPSPPTANSSRQLLTIYGSGFVSGSQVTLRIGGSTYIIPAERTQFVSSGQVQVSVGLTDAGTWSAQVTNPVGSQSSIFTFQVVR